MSEIAITDLIADFGQFILNCLGFFASDSLGIIAIGLCAVAFGFALFYNLSGAEHL